MKKTYTILFSILAMAIIGLLNWYDAPTMSDDVVYRFVWQEQLPWQEPYEHILSFNDVIKSQVAHYQYINGRSITHTMAQIAINLIPEHIAKLLNTVMLLLLLWLVTKYVAVSHDNRLFVASLAFGLIFVIMSGFYTGFIWLLGAFVYLWALIFTLVFLLMLRWLQQRPMCWKLLPLIPLSFLLGWSHEAIALPLSVSFLLYMIRHRQGLFRQTTFYCMIAYTLGMLMIIVTPALWSRADIGGIPFMQRIISGMLNIFLGLRISWLLVVTIAVIYFKDRKQYLNILKKQLYLLTAWIVAAGIVFTCGTSIDRVNICADFIALLILLDIWQLLFSKRLKSSLILVFSVFSLMMAIPAIAVNYQNYQNYQYHRQQLSDKHTHIIKVRQLPSDMNFIMKQIAKRYLNATIEFGFYNVYMAFDQNDINNKCMATIYHKDYVIFLPEDVVNRIEQDSAAYQNMEPDEHEKLYILQLQDQQKVEHLTFLLGNEVQLEFYQHYFSYPGNEYELNPFNYEVINIRDRNYLVMTIPVTSIKRRIKDIRIN